MTILYFFQQGGADKAAGKTAAAGGLVRKQLLPAQKKARGQEKGEKRKKTDCEKAKKKSRKASPSSSSSRSSSSESSSGSSAEGGGGSAGSDSSGEEENLQNMTASQLKEKIALEKKWAVLNQLWPKENRPQNLQKKADITDLSLDLLMVCKAEHRREEEERGVGTTMYGRDKKLKPRKYKAMTDDNERKFHPARFDRTPPVEPRKYYKRWPVKREPIYRHIPLQHFGIEGQVVEATIVRMHNRGTPVEMESLTREKVWNNLLLSSINLYCEHPPFFLV